MKTRFFAAIVALILSGTVSAASAIFDGQTLSGFDGILVDGQSYNVRFGTTFDFDTMVYDYNFSTQSSAALANEFQGQVWDLNPAMTNSCLFEDCNILTISYGTTNTPLGAPLFGYYHNVINTTSLGAIYSEWGWNSIVIDPVYTFSTWTSAPIGEVPIPAAAFMFAPALLGFMGLRRKAKNSVA